MAEKGSNLFVKGCLGCLGLVVVVVILMVFFGLWVTHQASRPAHMETREMAQEVPPLPAAEDASAEGAPGKGAPGKDAPSEAAPGELPALGDVELPLEIPEGSGPRALTLELDLGMGEFELEPGEPGQPIRVEAEFDTNRFHLEEEWDEEANRYRVSFGSVRGRGWFQFGPQGRDTRLRVIVPRDYPIALVADVGVGQSRFELGGLWLTAADLDFGAGDHRVEIGEPLRVALESFSLAGSVGEMELAGLGNASPREVTISHSAGEVDLDLSGAWRRDARITVETGFGECRLRLPEDVHVEVDSAHMGLGEVVRRDRQSPDLPPEAPTLSIEISGSAGELVIENR